MTVSPNITANWPTTSGSLTRICKNLASCLCEARMLNVVHRNLHGAVREMSKTYAAIVYGVLCITAGPKLARAQAASSADADRPTCAALLSNDSSAGTHLGPTDSAGRARDTTSRSRSDTASFGIGGARNGPADVILLVGVHADEVKFAAQPHVRVRLCWGGDTLRVVQRDNLPSPVVPGTTYRNVYVAVELIGRVNAECLADKIGVGNSAAQNAARSNAAAAAAPVSASNCAFLGASAASGSQTSRPPPP
jgi:hypothetical protein